MPVEVLWYNWYKVNIGPVTKRASFSRQSKISLDFYSWCGLSISETPLLQFYCDSKSYSCMTIYWWVANILSSMVPNYIRSVVDLNLTGANKSTMTWVCTSICMSPAHQSIDRVLCKHHVNIKRGEPYVRTLP